MKDTVRIALVTGATSGIGQWIVLGLLQHGMRVLAVGRDAGRGAALLAWLREQGATAGAELLLADLGTLAGVRGLADAVRARTGALHVLVNNAALYQRRRVLTADGIERTLAVNHVAPFLLTRELLPLLRQADGARVVNVGSAASDRATIALDDLNLERGWSSFRAYSQSKLALMLATFELARRLAGAGITANVVHPGVVATRIGDVGGLSGLAWALARPLLLTPRQGAQTPLHVATAPGLTGVSGGYFKKSAPAEPNPIARDPAVAARLWAETEAMIAAAG
jgi:NAD(P)-dependent dehydrogenase (short-subunit alcohol dehydrogenase family)